MLADEIEIRVEAHHKLTYSQNVEMVAQQKRGRIRGRVTEHPASGEAMSIADLVGTVDAVRVHERDRRNMDNRPDNTRRWLVFREKLKSGQYIDSEEKLKKAMDPTAVYTKTHTSAVVRELDDVIMGIEKQGARFVVTDGGILGAATEGKRGTAKSDLPDKCFIEAAGSGLSLAKLRQAKRDLNLDEHGLEDEETTYAAITPWQVDDLLKIAEDSVPNLNAYTVDQLKNGKPTTLLGFEWIVTNRLPYKSGLERMCPIWTKSNIHLGLWQDVRGRMWNDTSADNTPYCVVDARADCGRVEDDGVRVILCDETQP